MLHILEYSIYFGSCLQLVDDYMHIEKPTLWWDNSIDLSFYDIFLSCLNTNLILKCSAFALVISQHGSPSTCGWVFSHHTFDAWRDQPWGGLQYSGHYYFLSDLFQWSQCFVRFFFYLFLLLLSLCYIYWF